MHHLFPSSGDTTHTALIDLDAPNRIASDTHVSCQFCHTYRPVERLIETDHYQILKNVTTYVCKQGNLLVQTFLRVIQSGAP